MFSAFRPFLFSALGAATLCLSSCGESRKPAATTGPAATTPVAEARYECPMGCAGSQADKPGKCPTCGMELEKKS